MVEDSDYYRHFLEERIDSYQPKKHIVSWKDMFLDVNYSRLPGSYFYKLSEVLLFKGKRLEERVLKVSH